MGYLVCNKCGSYYELQPGEHPEDFDDKCKCGGNLEYNLTPEIKNKNNEDTKSSESLLNKWKGQSTVIKAASIGVIILILLVSIVGVMGVFSPGKSTIQTPRTPVTPNNSNNQVQATWHNIATFDKTQLNTNGATPSFSTKGEKFKVVLSANAGDIYKYSNINFVVYPAGETKAYVDKGDIAKFNKGMENTEAIIIAKPSNYYVNVTSVNVNSFTIQIFDYY